MKQYSTRILIALRAVQKLSVHFDLLNQAPAEPAEETKMETLQFEFPDNMPEKQCDKIRALLKKSNLLYTGNQISFDGDYDDPKWGHVSLDFHWEEKDANTSRKE